MNDVFMHVLLSVCVKEAGPCSLTGSLGGGSLCGR